MIAMLRDMAQQCANGNGEADNGDGDAVGDGHGGAADGRRD